MTALNRHSALPLWAQLLDELRHRVASGGPDARLPTENELMAEFGVSRNTVRTALGRLQAEGLLERERGRGTFVARVELERRLPGPYSLAHSIQESGLEEHSDVRARRIVHPPAHAAASLGLPAGESVVFIARLRYAGDEPVAIDRSWLPRSLAEPLLAVDLSAGSLYDALAASGVRVTGGTELIRPVIGTKADRRLLRLPEGEAALAIERVMRRGDEPVEARSSILRGDRYRFRCDW
jgi:GntR family transcriptional regulator